MNRVEIAGGLTSDPATIDGGAAATVAVSTVRYNPETAVEEIETVFLRVEAFGTPGVVLADLTKGAQVYVVGEMTQTERTKRDGTTDRKTRVRAHMLLPTRTPRRRPVDDGGPF